MTRLVNALGCSNQPPRLHRRSTRRRRVAFAASLGPPPATCAPAPYPANGRGGRLEATGAVVETTKQSMAQRDSQRCHTRGQGFVPPCLLRRFGLHRVFVMDFALAEEEGLHVSTVRWRVLP
jgi:hypothetical protein